MRPCGGTRPAPDILIWRPRAACEKILATRHGSRSTGLGPDPLRVGFAADPELPLVDHRGTCGMFAVPSRY